MKKVIMSILLGAALALPMQSRAWVSYCRAGWGHVGYAHVGWGGACWHAGWHCGGVSTGTAVAAGMAGLATGAMVGAAAARRPVVVAPAPVVVAPTIPIGSIYYSLPGGAQGANISGAQYYVANGVFYKPCFGNNGVYYEVVANPI